MVLDDDVLEAVLNGDVDAVEAWLAADPSRTVNDFAYEGLLRAGRATMLSFLAACSLGLSFRAAGHCLPGCNAGDRAAATRGRTAPSPSSAKSATMESCGKSSSSGARRGDAHPT